jgi:hypothetical protein
LASRIENALIPLAFSEARQAIRIFLPQLRSLKHLLSEDSMKTEGFLKSRFELAVGVAFVVLLVCGSVFAQGTTSIRGTVKDPQGNVIAGATVTARDLATNSTRSTTTADNGTYNFELINSGEYSLEVEAKGFKKGVVTQVQALVAKPTNVDIQLEVGNVSESVTVSAGSGEVLVNREDATLGNNFVNLQITQLPLESRNVLGLLTLQPGVSPSGYVAGARSDQSNITLDGVDINEAQTNSINSPVIRLNAEAIEEFRVITTNANSSAGRSSGAQISLVTRSGSNEFHGSLFWSHRNTVTTANDFFNNRIGLERPTLLRNVYGGTIGGPIMKDKAFFFYSYEGRRDASQTPAPLRTVPLASMGLGQLKYRISPTQVGTLSTAQLNQAFPVVGMNPVAINALRDAAARYPANDFTTGGDGINTAGYRFNAPLPVENESQSVRFDFKLNSNHSIMARGNYIRDVNGGIPFFPDTPPTDLWSHPWGIVVGHDWVLGSNKVNTFRYGVTRQAFSQQGDSGENSIFFRFVFQPVGFTRTVSRTTPVQNFTDDFSWNKGNHAIQFGTNIRVVRNSRVALTNAFDTALTNPSFYAGAGTVQSDAISAYLAANGLPAISAGVSDVQNAVTALIGRFSQYTANFTFDADGSLLTSGTPSSRRFATEEYDWYAQDAWKIRPNLTLTLGLRYGLSRPVYEQNGFETQPNIPLGTYFQNRLDAAAAGRAFNDLITITASGPANGGPPMYNWDKNNFQPRIAVAWSPSGNTGWRHTLFGNDGDFSIRGGFAITNDYFGSQLAATFDQVNALGFTSGTTVAANTFNTTTRPAPLFTGYGQAVRPLPFITVPGNLVFPQQQPADEAARIETSLDSALVSPINYTWNVSVERKLPAGIVIQGAYLGRAARNLLATRDIMALNNIKDPASGMDWYTAATLLEIPRSQNASVNTIQQIPYFANLWPADLAARLNAFYGGAFIPTNLNQTQTIYFVAQNFYGNDWTSTQLDLDDFSVRGPNLFYQPQYAALSAFGTIAKSNYHAGTLSIRQRLSTKLILDFNYTLSHSTDDASGLQTSGGYGAAFILNPIKQHQSYANSDFDIRHLINMNAIYQLPYGKGQKWGNDAPGVLQQILGGWQVSSIFRWNTGLPISTPFDDARWATNWNVQSNTTRLRTFETCPDRGGALAPNLFACDRTNIYQSFRGSQPGETGERNTLRLPGYWVVDTGLGKSFNMPWSENHKLQIRWETFNLTNTQHMGGIAGGRTGYGLALDTHRTRANGSKPTPPSSWANFVSIQGNPRVMQFLLRYEF